MSQIALQLYTLREQMAADPQGTLRAVAELGYPAVEVAGLAGLSVGAFRTTLDELGLQAPSCHISLQRLEQELAGALDEAEALGCAFVVCPWLPPDRRNAEGYAALATTLATAGAACAARGLQLCYHHHDFEFERFAGETALDRLLGATDAAQVQLEADIYWAAFAGHEPVALFERLAGRVPLVHLKDMAADAERSFAEVGHGTLDMPAIIAAATQAGARWLIVEQDRCARPPLESVAMSLEYLRRLGLARA
jgi:sugar phosphate isomerase/epimerase